MFGWRKKKDAFEWRQYVRTTLLLRREKRRERLENVKDAAMDHAKKAGGAAKNGAAYGAGKVGKGAAVTWGQIAEILGRPTVAGPLALTGVIALAAAGQRWQMSGPTRDALIPLAVGGSLLLASLPALTRKRAPQLVRISRAHIVTLGIAALGVAGLGWIAGAAPRGGGGFKFPQLASFSLLPAAKKPIEGRAQVVGGDTLRIGAATVQLAGIEAPGRDQRCGKGGPKKAWRCGEAARGALERIVKAKTVTCEPGSADGAGRIATSCVADGRDLAGELVRGGHVFATGGFLTQYGRLEGTARSARLGIWAGGEAERPSEQRARLASNTRK